MSETGLIRLSRLMALRRDLDNVANNVANVGTNGFKAQRTEFKEVLKRVERKDGDVKPERPVSLVRASSGFTDLSKGAIEPTGGALHAAIDGDAYFVVQTAEGERFTRDGAFTLDGSGRLVTAAGQPVLSASGPITLTSSDAAPGINADGSISTHRGTVGKLRLVSFSQPQKLVPVGANLFRSDQKPSDLPAGSAMVIPGALERSNVRPVVEMSRLVEVTRAYELVSAMMKQDGDKNELQRLADVL